MKRPDGAWEFDGDDRWAGDVDDGRRTLFGRRVARSDGDRSPVPMTAGKRVVLIAHDNCKADLLEWARYNRGTLAEHTLFATGTTGQLLEQHLGLPIARFRSGPLGGDQQVGAAIVDGGVDCLIFFWDPLEPHPHDVDVRALLRIAVVYNIPVACNRSTADFLLSSPLMRTEYARLVPEFGDRGLPRGE
ncbi:MAG TPA: methylglyoxal synthase [Gemmatimonadaceae bacterium]